MSSLLSLLIAVFKDLLSMKETLSLDDEFLIAFLKVVAVFYMPLRHQVVLDPDNLPDRLDECDLALELKLRM